MVIRIADEDVLLDMAETLDMLRASRSTVYRLMRSGRLVGHKIGRKWLFRKVDIRALVDSSRSPYATRP